MPKGVSCGQKMGGCCQSPPIAPLSCACAQPSNCGSPNSCTLSPPFKPQGDHCLLSSPVASIVLYNYDELPQGRFCGKKFSQCAGHCICQEKRLSKHFGTVIYLWFGAVIGMSRIEKVQYLSAVLDTRTCKEAEVTTRSDLSMDKTLVLMVTTDCTQRE